MPSLVKPQSRYVAARPKTARIQPRHGPRHVTSRPAPGGAIVSTCSGLKPCGHSSGEKSAIAVVTPW